MEIHLFYCIVCAISILHLEAKPFSLNKAIAENSERKLFETLTNISPENSEETFPLKGALRPSSATQKIKEIGDILLLNTLKKKRSPLQYKKKIHLKKPKLGKIPTKPRFKRKNPPRQLEKYDHEGINRRYLPLLRSISMLFDDILSTDSQSSEVEDFTSHNTRRDYECSCARQADLEPAQSRPQQKTTAATEASSTQVPVQIEATTTEADITTPIHFSTFRQNKVIPALFPRNTPGFRRNYNGIGKGDSSARHRNIKNLIARNRGDSEYDTRERRDETYTQDNEEDTERDTRNSANGVTLRGGRLSGGTNRSRNHTTTTENTVATHTEAVKDIRGYVNEFKRYDSIETGRDTTESAVQATRNKTESKIHVPGFNRRLRGHTAKIKIPNHSKSLQPEEFYEKGVLNVTLGFPSGKRRVNGAGFTTEKDQKDRTANERLESLLSEQNTKNKNMVMIIDGYSVARDKNGENQFVKKQYKYVHK